MDKDTTAESLFEKLLCRSRWLAAPPYLGLVFGLIIVLLSFFSKLFSPITGMLALTLDEAAPLVLSFIDIALNANLAMIVFLQAKKALSTNSTLWIIPTDPSGSNRWGRPA